MKFKNYGKIKKTFSLITFNVYQTYCKEKEIKDIENDLKCDIICTQEEPKNHIEFKNYERLQRCGDEGETVGVYYNKALNPKPNFIKCIKTTPSDQNAPRVAIIFSFNTYKIANLHLEGGRNIDKNLYSDFKNKLKYKMELLEQVVSENPDIIVGDFNSVYISDENKM